MRYSMEPYLLSGSQVIHIQKTLACIGLQHVHMSSKKACRQLGTYLCSPLSANRKQLQNGKCQWQAWFKDALVFLVQEMYLVSACIWNGNISNTVNNFTLTSQADHSSQANTLYLWLWAYIYQELNVLCVSIMM